MSMLDMMVETVRGTDVDEIVPSIDRDALREAEVIVGDTPALYVSMNLDSREMTDCLLDDEIMDGIIYRRLDARYYAWLRNKMSGIRKAKDAGKLSPKLFERLRERFNAIHAWAVANIGEDALLDAVHTFDPSQYMPPASIHVTEQSNSKLSPEAMRLGQLLSTRGYAVITSPIIDAPIVFVRDDSISVPTKWADKVRFTLTELTAMIGLPVETVRRIYDTKQIFGGRVVPSDGSGHVPAVANDAPSSGVQLSLGRMA